MSHLLSRPRHSQRSRVQLPALQHKHQHRHLLLHHTMGRQATTTVATTLHTPKRNSIRRTQLTLAISSLRCKGVPLHLRESRSGDAEVYIYFAANWLRLPTSRTADVTGVAYGVTRIKSKTNDAMSWQCQIWNCQNATAKSARFGCNLSNIFSHSRNSRCGQWCHAHSGDDSAPHGCESQIGTAEA